MTLAIVKRWFNRLPEAERDLPIVTVGGVAFTPRMILAEVERGTPLGRRLQAMIETGQLAASGPEDLERLAKLRLKMVLERLPERPLIACLREDHVRVYTPRQLLREVEAQTELGRAFIEAELEAMRRLIAMARR